MPPRFITFEGLDGCGKTTHLRRTADWLRGAGHEVVCTHEPGGTPLGNRVRQVFLDPSTTVADGTVEALLVFASRRQNLLEVIEPGLAAGRLVLCDRFTDSTLAYQGHGRGVPASTLLDLEQVATGGRRPDLTLLFDLPPETAQQRSQRGERSRERGVDRIDAEELAFYCRVREGFLALAADEPARFRVLDSSGTVEETEAQVRAALAEVAAAPEGG